MNSGMLVRFHTAEQLVEAVRALEAHGWTDWETFSPHPILEIKGQTGGGWVSRVTFISGVFGLLAAVAMQVIPTGFLYPLKVGGKPMLTWAAFFPIAFESTILCSAIGAFLAMLFTAGLPRWHRRIFDVEEFRKVSRDAYFVLVYCENHAEAADLLTKVGGEVTLPGER